ncbi:hypothetical protein IWQ61_005684 [Dispira simplex]|nr:hypothetical protein IWQ61_005684 [Dispira simplex]
MSNSSTRSEVVNGVEPRPPSEGLKSTSSTDFNNQPKKEDHSSLIRNLPSSEPQLNEPQDHRGDSRQQPMEKEDDDDEACDAFGRRIPRDREASRPRTRTSVPSLDQRHRSVNHWDEAPTGFEHRSVQDAKTSGQFPSPRHVGTSRRDWYSDDDRRDEEDSYRRRRYHQHRRSRSRSRSRTRSTGYDRYRRSRSRSTDNNRGVRRNDRIDRREREEPLPRPVIPSYSGRRDEGQGRPRVEQRLYVGNIPMGIAKGQIVDFFNHLMTQVDPNCRPGTQCVTDIHYNVERSYAFLEFLSAEQADLGMSLDGVVFNGQQLRIRRPKDYPGSGGQASGMGTSGQLQGVSNFVDDGPNKLFIGSIPASFNQDQVAQILLSFGPLKSFHFVKNPATGLSKGFAFCEFADPALTDIVCEGLNGMSVGDRHLVVQRADVGSRQHRTGYDTGGSLQSHRSISLGGYPAQLPPTLSAAINDGTPRATQPTTVLQLLNMVTPEELANDEEYQDIQEDIRDECTKFGTVVELRIPRPNSDQPGVGKIFVKFADSNQALSAMNTLAGRKFADRTVVVSFIQEDDFLNQNY